MNLEPIATAPPHDRLLVWGRADRTLDGVIEADGDERWGEAGFHLIDHSGEDSSGHRVFYSTLEDPWGAGTNLIVDAQFFVELPTVS